MLRNVSELWRFRGFPMATNKSVATHVGLHAPGTSTAKANPPVSTFNETAPFSAAYAQGDPWFATNVYATPALDSFEEMAGIRHRLEHHLGLGHGRVTVGSRRHLPGVARQPRIPQIFDPDLLPVSGGPIQLFNNRDFPTTTNAG